MRSLFPKTHAFTNNLGSEGFDEQLKKRYVEDSMKLDNLQDKNVTSYLLEIGKLFKRSLAYQEYSSVVTSLEYPQPLGCFQRQRIWWTTSSQTWWVSNGLKGTDCGTTRSPSMWGWRRSWSCRTPSLGGRQAIKMPPWMFKAHLWAPSLTTTISIFWSRVCTSWFHRYGIYVWLYHTTSQARVLRLYFTS